VEHVFPLLASHHLPVQTVDLVEEPQVVVHQLEELRGKRTDQLFRIFGVGFFVGLGIAIEHRGPEDTEVLQLVVGQWGSHRRRLPSR
jgi:hypothetical protein